MARPLFPDCSVSAGALLLLAAGILLLPMQWLSALVIAGTVHELCHIIALQALSIPVYAVHIGFHGAAISTPSLYPRQELVAAAAGPAGSLALLFFFRSFPELALCGLVQGLYNLLPLYPSDGGRILRCALILRWPGHADAVMGGIRTAVFVMLGFCGLAVIRGWLTLFLLIALLLHAFRKIPCKESHLALQ